MSNNELGILLATIGVIVGVLLEGWEHWDEYKKKGLKPIVPKIGFAILVISLAIEIIFDARLAQESANTELKAAQLQKAVAWRSLDVACANAAITELFKFAKQKASVQSEADDIESVFFSFDIQSLLNSARWNVPKPLAIYGGPSVSIGVLVMFGADDESSNAGLALYGQLKTCGVLVYKGSPDANLNGEVAIRVNHRLPPDAFSRIKP
jgi:hypothetical protein